MDPMVMYHGAYKLDRRVSGLNALEEIGRGHTKETGNRNATAISITCHVCSTQADNSSRNPKGSDDGV
jgi:hypothetical protein